MLSDETGDHACEGIAASTFSKPRIPGSVHPDLATVVSDKRSPAFENQNNVVLACESARGFDAIRFYFLTCTSDHSGFITWMRTEHQWPVGAPDFPTEPPITRV